jgi:hypothetical protein
LKCRANRPKLLVDLKSSSLDDAWVRKSGTEEFLQFGNFLTKSQLGMQQQRKKKKSWIMKISKMVSILFITYHHAFDWIKKPKWVWLFWLCCWELERSLRTSNWFVANFRHEIDVLLWFDVQEIVDIC